MHYHFFLISFIFKQIALYRCTLQLINWRCSVDYETNIARVVLQQVWSNNKSLHYKYSYLSLQTINSFSKVVADPRWISTQLNGFDMNSERVFISNKKLSDQRINSVTQYNDVEKSSRQSGRHRSWLWC